MDKFLHGRSDGLVLRGSVLVSQATDALPTSVTVISTSGIAFAHP